MKIRHTFEEKLLVISMLLSGEPLATLCRKLGMDKKNVRIWLARYRKYGESGLKRIPGYRFSTRKKMQVVKEFAEKGIPLHELCLRYDLSRATILRWTALSRKGISLENKSVGRPPKDCMSRPKKKQPQTELEKLQAENLRLRAENALLKKVKALVEEQEARTRLNGQKPSTN